MGKYVAATGPRRIRVDDDVPSSVELRRRSGEHQAALTSSLCTAGPIGSANSRSSAARSAGRCRWPLTRRNCLPASTIPAAHQRSAIRPSRQRLTLLACSRHTEIIDSMALVERSIRASVGGTPRRSTVRVSSRPSRRLAAAPGWVRSNSLARASSVASASSAEPAWVGVGHLTAQTAAKALRQTVFHVPDLVNADVRIMPMGRGWTSFPRLKRPAAL